MSFGAHNGRVARRGGAAAAMGAAALALATAAGCGGASDEPRLNLLLISLDTLRADRLGAYGYDRETSPALDAFAERCVRFEHAIAPSPWTVPSHVSLLSGLLPSTHGVHTSMLKPGPDTTLLAELLFPAGWYTFGVTDGGNVAGALGFDRGFRSYRDTNQPFAGTVREAEILIGDREPHGPWFAFLHTYDIHCPYDPAEPYRSMFQSDGRVPADIDGKCGNPWLNEMDLSPEQALYVSDRYDGGIREVDDVLGRFLGWLEAEGHLADTVVVITSDHGEEFLEHGQIGHERSLHRELLEVPLLVYAPGLAPGVVDAPVSLVDVMPTVLELLGQPVPDGLDGRSLLPLVDGTGTPADGQPATLRWQEALDAWWTKDSHLIVDQQRRQVHLYDVASDPLAQVDVAGDEQPRAEALLQALQARLAEGQPRAAVERGALSEAEAERLRALGYVDVESR